MNVMIVLNYNDWQNTYSYIKKIDSFKKLHYILIVDNCSTDNSYDHLVSLKNKKVNIIQTDENKGYAYGNNFGVHFLEQNGIVPNLLIISNPDIDITEESFDILINQFEMEPSDTFAITGLIYDRNMNISPWYAWKQLSYGKVLRESTFFFDKAMKILHVKGREYGLTYLESGERIEVDVLPGCFFIANFNLWKELNGFDESNFLFYEEDFLAAKVHDSGYHNYIIPQAKVKHMQGVTVNKNINSYWKKCEIGKKSCLTYLKKVLKIGRIKEFIYLVFFYVSRTERFIYNLCRKKN